MVQVAKLSINSSSVGSHGFTRCPDLDFKDDGNRFTGWMWNDAVPLTQCVAGEFKEEMKKRFNYPKTTSRYQVVHGTSESGKNVFVESRGNKKMKGRRLNEMFSSVEEENDAVENFCILMDWEVEPKDVLHCVKNSDGNFTMQLNDGIQFTYDPVNDCLTD